ncbi:MAG: DegT/DnrJ/EryC1/StrS family aminotransferase [bacterium]
MKDIPGVSLNCQDENTRVNGWMSSIVIDPKVIKINRDELRKRLKERLVDTRPFFPQLSKSDAYFTEKEDIHKKINPNANLVAEN